MDKDPTALEKKGVESVLLVSVFARNIWKLYIFYLHSCRSHPATHNDNSYTENENLRLAQTTVIISYVLLRTVFEQMGQPTVGRAVHDRLTACGTAVESYPMPPPSLHNLNHISNSSPALGRLYPRSAVSGTFLTFCSSKPLIKNKRQRDTKPAVSHNTDSIPLYRRTDGRYGRGAPRS